MQPQTSQDALTQLQQFQGSLKTPQDALDAAKNAIGVNAAKDTVTGLSGAIKNTTNLLNQVAPSVYGRTANSLVTSAGASRQIANESAPLAATLEKQNNDFSGASQNYRDLLGEAENQANGTIADQNTRLGLMQNVYDNLYGREQDAAKSAESKRQFDITRNDSLAQAAASRSASSAADSKPTKVDIASHVVQQLNTLRGKDGKVSNETWQNALNDWTAIGGTVREFWKNYGDYVNPKFKSSYAGYVNR